MVNVALTHTDTRQKIINATLLVAAKHGFDRATTGEISRTAGVSEGIIYHYFRSKEELCVNMVKEKAAEFRAKVVEGIENISSPYNKLEKLIGLHADFVTSGGGLFRILFNRTGGKSIMFKQALKYGILPYAEIIEEIIKDGMDKGVFKQVEPKITALNLIGMMQIALIPILLGEVSFTAEETKKNIMKVFFGGILK